MLNGLDLFAGIGGNSLALKMYVRTLGYCEADRHAQAVLLSRMREGSIGVAPICSDIKDLEGSDLKGLVDIIVGGFPCQDISVAGKGQGLAGERSGLFFEIVRLAKEIEPTFLFLENVPAIRTRGLDRVIEELTALSYDLRWTMLSAQEVGAPHKRERWFCLANASRRRLGKPDEWEVEEPRGTGSISASPFNNAKRNELWNESRGWSGPGRESQTFVGNHGQEKSLADANTKGSQVWEGKPGNNGEECPTTFGSSWWSIEPNVDRVVNGLPLRVERIKRLGNAVVPFQAKTAFEILMGINTL